jgi:type IX secretion system PorP/SprF family membrane protein
MSQTPGPFYRQYLFNPYLFNPAFVAINDQPELNLVYRKQWVNFQNAPVTTGISLQYPTQGRVSLGLNIMNDKQVLLTNNTFMGTFGYTVPISDTEAIRFGLSAGVGTNKLDLSSEGINVNDPAIINAANNNVYVDGNFGVAYTNKGLRLGFALTEIFQSDPFTEDAFSEFVLSNLKNRIYSASYKFNVGVMETLALEPYALYRQSEDGLQDAWEAGSMLYYKDVLWTGASYNQNNGLGLFLGMNVMDKFRFSYSYEFPPFNSEISSTSSHELHLGVRFGTKKSRAIAKNHVKKTTPVAKTTNRPVEQQKNETKGDSEVSSQHSNTPVNEPVHEGLTITNQAQQDVTIDHKAEGQVEVASHETDISKPSKSFTPSKGHYVVVGAFRVMSYATRYARSIKAKGFPADIALNPKKKLYYVYVFSSYDIDEAKRIRNDYRLKSLFRDAWLYSME